MIKKPKILWLLNTHFSYVPDEFDLDKKNCAGWLDGAYETLVQRDMINLCVCFPYVGTQNYKKASNDTITFYGFKPIGAYNPNLTHGIDVFKQIIAEENPDLVHIFGTEFSHTLAMTKAFNIPSKTVIHIQGLCSIYATHYLEGIDIRTINKKSFAEKIKRKGLLYNQDMFVKRGEFEIKAIQSCDHIIGRTTFDKACTRQINKNATYYHGDETLRHVFYQDKWQYETCEKHRIFLSQGNYAAKGLHYMLKALYIIRSFYPDVKLVVAGEVIIKQNTLMDKIKETSYPRYIKRLIREYDLKDHITYTGLLDAQQMKEAFLNSHVFASCSSIENSPNSMGEAMMLGVPCVCSNVGGVSDLMEHKKHGLTYPSTAYYMLAHYIMQLFEDRDLCESLSKQAIKKAQQTHDINKNTNTLLDIYDTIIQNQKGEQQ